MNRFSAKIGRFGYFRHNLYLRIAKMLRYFPCRSKQYASTVPNYNHKQHIWHSVFENCGTKYEIYRILY